MGLPVAVDRLPEYRDCVEWAVKMRADVEADIASEAVNVPSEVFDRIQLLVGDTISKRDFEIVELWSGVGIRGIKPGRYYNLATVMRSVSALPCVGTELRRWWYEHVRGERRHEEGIRKINLYSMLDGGTEESMLALKRVLRSVLLQMAEAAPSPVEVAVFYMAEAGDEEVCLSSMVSVVNSLRYQLYLVQEESPERNLPFEKRVSPAQLHSLLIEADIVDYEVDCGAVEGVDRMRELVGLYGRANLKSCLNCTGWFAESEEQQWRRNDRCAGCGHYGRINFDRGGDQPSAEDELVSFVRAGMEAEGDISRNMALTYGISPEDAEKLLTGKLLVLGEVDVREGRCPVAASCKTLCGVLQHKFGRKLPFTYSGQYATCVLYQFLDENRETEGEERQEAARKALVQSKTIQTNQHLLLEVSRGVAPKADDAETEEEAQDSEDEVQVGVQGMLL